MGRLLRVLVAFAVVPPPVVAQDTIPVIEVTATGVVEREAELARIMFAVQSSAATAREAGQANAVTMDRLIGELKKLPHVSGVRTVSYHVSPRYAPRDRAGDPQPIGYTVHNTVQAVVDSVRLVGATIDVGLAAGANQVAGLSFELRDPEAAYRDALAQAVAEARSQATALAAAAGGRLGPIRSINTGGNARPSVMLRGARPMMQALDVPTPIEPGESRVSATVTVEFLLLLPPP